MARKVLGRGLSALLGEEPGTAEREELVEIDIDQIEPNSEQPRTIFEETSLEELAQSIRVNGIVQPILIRKKGQKYQLIAGERRWRAAQRAGFKKMQAIVREVDDDRMLEIALIENIQRQELNAVEEARAYRKLIDTVGLTQDKVAERVGKNRTTITTFLRLLKLPDDILGLVEQNKISAGHARVLLMANDAASQRNLARKIIDKALSVRETEKAVKRAASGGSQLSAEKQIKPKLDANLKAAETKLRRHLGTQVHIQPDGNGTGGKLTIEYYSNSDLDRIYDLVLGKK